MSQFVPGKLLDFFRHFNPARPQHVEAVRRLERSLRDKAPELLHDEAYWVQAWRKPVTPPVPAGPEPDLRSKVRLQAQSNSVSCGQASCAMAIEMLTGQDFDDKRFNLRHRFGLLDGLRLECPQHDWRDAGNLSSELWAFIEEALSLGCPAVIGLNGPAFSPSGRGHIVLIVALIGKAVWYADPATGGLAAAGRRDMETCPPHPDGKFVFLAKPR